MVTLETLYSDYLKELAQYDPSLSAESAKEILEGYRKRHYTTKIIFDDGAPVGFLIIAEPPDCHPDCDYFICQAYVDPAHRRKGLMSTALSEFVEHHQGRYCLDVIFGNLPARTFWSKRFKELGYASIALPFIEHGVTGVCETLGFGRRHGET